MEIINSPEQMHKTALGLRRQGGRIGFVPTMGFLHEGHMSLVKLARREADVVVVSIFVNPLQFGPQEDFEKYPRNFARDAELCRQNGVDFIFNPSAADMYPGFAKGSAGADLTSGNFNVVSEPPRGARRPPPATYGWAGRSARGSCSRTAPRANAIFIDENDLSKQLCGRFRPGHFRGVLTVVAKLFNIVMPDSAVFGQKDAQQAILIQRMIRDLDFPVRAVIAPIVREPDGLAMSSRNSYLNPDERRRAVCLSLALKRAMEMYRAGERNCSALKKEMLDEIAKAKPDGIDYVEIVAEKNLRPIDEIKAENCLIALAVRIGRTRLIDNLPLPDDRLGNLPE